MSPLRTPRPGGGGGVGGAGSEPLRRRDLRGPRVEQEVSQGREPEGPAFPFLRVRRAPAAAKPARPTSGDASRRWSRGFLDELETGLGWPRTESGPAESPPRKDTGRRAWKDEERLWRLTPQQERFELDAGKEFQTP